MAMVAVEEDELDLDALVADLALDVKQAQDFMDEAWGSERERAERYYSGHSDLPVDGNRSHYVATKVRDTIRGVRPSLLRLFLGGVAPVEFRPSGPNSVDIARQQTLFVEQQFDAAGGYGALRDAIDTSCLHKVGPVQYFWDEQTETQYRSFTNLSAEQFQILQQQPNIQVVSTSQETVPAMGPDGQVTEQPLISVEVAYLKPCGKLRVEPVLLNEFIIDDGAVNGRPPRVVGRQVSMTISEVLRTYPEVDREALEEIDDRDPELYRNTGESEARRGYNRRYGKRKPADPSMRKVLITDVFWDADLDGTGVAQTWRWILGGISMDLLHYERAEDGHNFALFQIDPKPGAVFGESLYDLTHEDQDGITSLTRGVIDNARAVNNPRITYHETMVNADDVLNFDIGAPIRFKAPGMILPIAVPFAGGQIMPFLEYWNNDVENKTGVSRASIGLDPRALQSTDKQAVQNTIQQGAGQVEVMARNLAETGMVPLMRGILRLCMRHQDPQQVIWITGEEYEPVDLRYFDPSLTMRVNVGIGAGDDEKRAMALQQVMGMQEKIIGGFGPMQPVVQPHHVTQAMTDYLKILGVKDTNRYLANLTPDASQQLIEQMKQDQGQPKADPTVEAAKEMETIRSQTRLQEKTLESELRRREKIVDTEMAMAEAAMTDDRERDRMLQDLYIAAGKLVLEGGKLNVAGIQAQQRASGEQGKLALAQQAQQQRAAGEQGKLALAQQAQAQPQGAPGGQGTM